MLSRQQEVSAMLSSSLLRTTLVSAALAVFAAGASFTPAQAEDGRNAAAIAGAIGGFAAGAAVGGGGPRYYDPPHTATTRVYRDRRVVVEEPGCRTIVRKRVNEFGERVTVRREICD
jgi:hypothetical protein